MDWSLVLASQGIEHAIEAGEDAWWLIVSEMDAAQAAEAIHAYERENVTVWRREVKWTGLLFDWRAAFWWLFVAAMFWLSTAARPELREAGLFQAEEFLHGHWWRAVTAVTLHADATHLAFNASTGLLLLGLAMGCFGYGRGLLASLVCGVGANIFQAFLESHSLPSLGASGMVMGSLGLVAAQSLFERHTAAREWLWRGVLAGALLFVMLGLDVKSNVLAHLLGFVTGIVLGIVLCFIDRQFQRRAVIELCSGILTAGLVVIAWALAIRAS
jgi:membrane associated rhomboid family serine protease